MKIWIIVTIVIVVLASLGAAGGLTYFFIKKRSQRRASDAYTKSLIDEALLADNLAKQQQVVNDIQASIDKSTSKTEGEQQAMMLKLAESQKELEQLKNNVTLAVKATNSLGHLKNAVNNQNIAVAARDATSAELKAVEDRNKAASKTTVDALNFTTSELKKQAADLRAFKASLQEDAMKLAADVGNPSILPPEIPDSLKPSIRTIWDAAVDAVATSDDQDLVIKQLSELYKITGADADDLKNAARQLAAEPPVCERITKIQIDNNNAYGCPSGWSVFGDQCYRGPCDNSPAPAPKPLSPSPAPAPKPLPPSPAPKPKPAPKPAPKPNPSVGSVVLLGNEVRVNLSNKTTAGGGRGFSQKWPIPSQFKNAVKMSFDINFQPGFSFGNNNHSEGGKVGGLHVGPGAASGCRHTDNGSSLRLVWDGGPDKRFKGSGASAYTYLPTGAKGKQPSFVEKDGWPNCGYHFWRKESDNIFSNTGSWYTVTLGIKLNDVGKNNGRIYYEIKGPKSFRAEEGGIIWRTGTYDIREASISSFFGGGGNQKNVLPSTYLLKNVMLSPY